MQNMIKLRPARLPDDIPSIVALWFDVSIVCHNFIDPDYWAQAQEPMASIYIPNCQTIVATCDNKIIGFVSLSEHTLEALFVLPEYQGHGVGARLLQAAYQEKEMLDLKVYQKNTHAKSFYEHHGFVITDSSTDENTNEAEWIMTCSNCSTRVKGDHVQLAPYNPAWPQLAEQEINTLRETLNSDNIVDMQHVGSTSIPNAIAKPVIDIYVGVKSLEQAKQDAIKPLEDLGYLYWANNPSTTRMTFIKGMPPYGEERTHHVHITEHKSARWNKTIAFRDYLRTHPDALQQYCEIKKQLATQHTQDRETYTDAKSDFVESILAKC